MDIDQVDITKILSLILILLVSFVCVTCSNSKKQEYFYENGNIKERLIYSNKKDTSFYSVTRYYLNGQISEKGTIKDGYKEGTWEYWYSDGEIRWKENFSKGIYQKPINSVPVISFQKDTLRVGEKVYMRVKSKNSLMKDLNIGCTNGIIQRADNEDLYDFR